MSLPWTSARLAAWTAAFLDDAVSPDDVTDAITLGAVHRISGLGLDGAGDGPVGVALGLSALRSARPFPTTCKQTPAAPGIIAANHSLMGSNGPAFRRAFFVEAKPFSKPLD